MRVYRRFISTWRTLFRKEELRAELDEELESVLEMLAAEKMRAGLSRAEALREARLELGGVEQVKSRVRENRLGAGVDSLLQDVRFALRQFSRNPGFAAVAILTLTLGIGANTAVFSVVNQILFRPLPYAEENRVATIWNRHEDGRLALSENELLEYRSLDGLFSHVGAYVFGSLNLTRAGETERLPVVFASADVLPALGVDPVRGRRIAPEEDVPGAGPVVLLSESLWERRFGRDPQIFGRALVMNGLPRTVVGILPRGFRVPGGFQGPAPDVVAPLQLDPAAPDPRNLHYLNAVARLRSGASVEQASAGLHAAATRLKERLGTLPETFTARVVPVRDDIVGDVRPALMALLAAVALVLLIACVNVVNLLLARSDTRTREMAVRASLGAGPGRLVRQLATETALLAVVGGAGGLLVGVLGARGLGALAPPGIPRIETLSVGPAVFLFSLLVTGLAAGLIAFLPAWRVMRGEGVDALRGARGSTGGADGMRTRRGLVTAQVALAVLLGIGAGLLVRSLAEVRAVDPGFETNGSLTFQVTLPSAEYPDAPATRRFFEDLRRQLEALPGVDVVGGTTGLPLAGRVGDWGVRIRGRGPDGLGERGPAPDWMVVSPGYFEAMRIPLLRGRPLQPSNGTESAQAVVINDAFARRHWSDGDALGAQIRMTTDLDTLWRTVVGIVGDIRQASLKEEPRPAMYLPHAQFPSTDTSVTIGQMSMVIRTGTSAPGGLAPAVRAVVRRLDPNVAVANLRTMRDVSGSATAAERFQSLLFGGFAFIALVLVLVGVYGVTSYLVTRRTRELGIRLALGASPARVRRLVLREGVGMTAVGLAIGLLAAVGLSRLLGSLLYGVAARDPLTFALVPLLLGATVLLSTALPAARAARVDPVETLRHE